MIKLNKISKHSVIRMSNYNPDTEQHECERFIGSYESFREAKFIATKALKMEKASVMLSKIAKDPSLEGQIAINNIFLSDVKYVVVDAVINTPTTNYVNGVSTIIHHLNEDNHYEKRMKSQETTGGLSMSFNDYALLREKYSRLHKHRFDSWTHNLIEDVKND